MAKSSPLQTSFNAGEFAPELGGRADIGKYVSSCTRMENFFPMVQGPARRRGGTRFVSEVKDSSKRTWLARFEFNTEQAYVLEFGDLYVRFYTDNGPLLATAQSITGITKANPGVLTYSGSDTYANGDWVYVSGVVGMTQVNGRTFKVGSVNTGSNTFSLLDIDGNNVNTSGYSTYTSGGTVAEIYTLTTPWSAADMVNADGSFALQMAQSGDILYICHPDYAPRKLSRTGASSWTLTTMEPEGGPFEDTDPDQTVTVYASAQTGSITLTASSGIFASTDVGRLFYLEQRKANSITKWEVGKSITSGNLRRSTGKTYKALNSATTGNMTPNHTVGAEYDGNAGVQWEFQDAGYGWVKITGYTSATEVSATVLSLIPEQATGSGNATTRWAFGYWGSANGYPSHVTFFRNRLVFARARDRKMWFSVAADYENFKDRDEGGQVTDDMAVTLTVESDQSANQIEYMVQSDALIIGTSGGEHICKEQTDSDPFGPANAIIVKSSDYGSRGVFPVQVGDSLLFVQRSGRKLREISFDALSDGYKSLDMSVLAPHMIPKGKSIVQMFYQKEPNSIIWCARSDGLLLGFTFNREQYTEPPFGGWHRHPLGGSGIVESVTCVPSPNNDRDDLWMIVRRTINGVTRRYVEFLHAEFDSGDDQSDAFYVDCGLTYDGAAATTISGLDHLEGKTVDILADGATHPQRTVTSGAITLQRAASVVQVGLPCPAKLATMRIEAGARDGTAQGKTKRINRMVVRFVNTLGGKMGPTETSLDEILFRSSDDAMDQAVPVYSGDKEIPWRGGYETDAIVWYVNDQPLPATVVALMPQITTQDR